MTPMRDNKSWPFIKDYERGQEGILIGKVLIQNLSIYFKEINHLLFIIDIYTEF